MNSSLYSALPPPIGWSASRQTHPAISRAIFAISSDVRQPEAIWATPTADEWLAISELVIQYIDDGDFAVDTGRFAWGPFETLRWQGA